MELKLNKIYRAGDDGSIVHISIEATYGWNGDMCRDMIRINYNENKREAFMTVKMLNPGVGALAARILELITGINYHAKSVKNPPRFIIEMLAEKLSLQYDPLEVDKHLS
jgi:hypothetical protein